MPEGIFPGQSIDFLKSLPPEAYKTIPFAKPPSGIKANFENPPTRVPTILGVSTTFLIITTLFLGVRAFAKVSIAKRWRCDDSFVVLGYIFSVAHFSGVVIACLRGAIGRHEWDVYLDKALGYGSLVTSYMCPVVTAPALGLIKISLFIQYYYAFSVIRYVRLGVYIAGSFTALFYLSISIAAFVMSSPWPGESLLDTIFSSHYLIFSKRSIAGGIVGLLVDWTLLVLPMSAVWRLHVSRRKRLGVMLILSTGALGVAASVMGLYYRILLQTDSTDTSWKVGYTLLWNELEMWSGITASCMPSIKQVFSYYVPRSSRHPTLNYSVSQFRHARPETALESDGAFRKWGYRSNVDTEHTAHITQGFTGVEMDIIAEERV